MLSHGYVCSRTRACICNQINVSWLLCQDPCERYTIYYGYLLQNLSIPHSPSLINVFFAFTAAAAHGVQSTPPLLAAWGNNPTFPTIHVYIKPGCSDEWGMFRDPGRLNSSQGSPAQPQRGRESGCIFDAYDGQGVRIFCDVASSVGRAR